MTASARRKAYRKVLNRKRSTSPKRTSKKTSVASIINKQNNGVMILSPENLRPGTRVAVDINMLEGSKPNWIAGRVSQAAYLQLSTNQNFDSKPRNVPLDDLGVSVSVQFDTGDR